MAAFAVLAAFFLHAATAREIAVGYGGPCPPPGKPHHYHITVYALDLDKLPIDASASPAVVGFYANAHTLAKATLTGLYGR